MFKLALTAGHYMGTPGKRCLKSIDSRETREWWLNNRIADEIENHLAKYEGIEILRTDDTTGQRDISLANRVAAANSFKADFYLSIHHNAGINGGSGGGIIAYVSNNCSAKSKEWQKDLYNELIKETGLKGNRSTPLASANFYEIKYTNMPAVLLELGFMDSTTDTPIILDQKYAEACAQACVNIIMKKAGLSAANTKPAVAPSNPSTSTPITRVNTLKVGSKGEEVRRLQNLLNLLNFNCGKADGTYGKNTQMQVEAFQRYRKISIDGLFGINTYNEMKKELASTKRVAIYENAKKKNPQALALQNILNDYGYSCGKADGVFGNKTEAALEAFQKKNGLNPDGICGPKTVACFDDYLKL